MKIAVMGSEPGSVKLAPFQNEAFNDWVQGRLPAVEQAHGQVPGNWDIWGCSPACWASIPRATRWFEVHRWEPQQPWFGPQYVDFLKRFPGVVYTGGHVPDIPGHSVYPIDHIEEKFGAHFLTSSLALMLALAIDTLERLREQRAIYRRQKAGEATQGLALLEHMSREQFEAELDKPDDDDCIGLWGVDMAATEEYGYQRPGCQFFIYEALRRGIGVFIPPESDLMRPIPVYGISEWDHNYIKLTVRARQLNQKAQEAQAVIAEATQKLAGTQGEQHAMNHFIQTWTCPYGPPAGVMLRHEPGTGLGSGITQLDARPIQRLGTGLLPPPVMQAMTDTPDEQARKRTEAVLAGFKREIQVPAETPDSTAADMAIAQAREYREMSALLQPFAGKLKVGTSEAVRILLTQGAPKAKRKGNKRRR